jgi:hypothetical protein
MLIVRRPLTKLRQIDALYECCNKFYERNGDDAKTVSCPKAGTLRFVRSLAQSYMLSKAEHLSSGSR